MTCAQQRRTEAVTQSQQATDIVVANYFLVQQHSPFASKLAIGNIY